MTNARQMLNVRQMTNDRRLIGGCKNVNNSQNTTIYDVKHINYCRYMVGLTVCRVWRQMVEYYSTYDCFFQPPFSLF